MLKNKNFEVRVISLPDQVQRREKMNNILKNIVDWRFVDAISGKEISHEIEFYDRNRRLKVFGYDMRINEIACFMSHRKTWEECALSDKNFLILEDDINIPLDADGGMVHGMINSISDAIGEKLLVRLGNSELRSEKAKVCDIDANYSIYRYHRDPLGAFAYLLSPDVARDLLASSLRVFTPVDDFMWRGWEHGCVMYDLAPHFFTTQEEGNPSTIGNRSKPKIALRKKIVREWYRFLDVKNKKKYEAHCFSQVLKIK